MTIMCNLPKVYHSPRGATLNISCPEVADGGVVTAKYGNAVYATIARNGACSMNLPLGLWDLEHGNIMNRISVPEFGVYNIDFSSSKRMTSPTGLTAAYVYGSWYPDGRYVLRNTWDFSSSTRTWEYSE